MNRALDGVGRTALLRNKDVYGGKRVSARLVCFSVGSWVSARSRRFLRGPRSSRNGCFRKIQRSAAIAFVAAEIMESYRRHRELEAELGASRWRSSAKDHHPGRVPRNSASRTQKGFRKVTVPLPASVPMHSCVRNRRLRIKSQACVLVAHDLLPILA